MEQSKKVNPLIYGILIFGIVVIVAPMVVVFFTAFKSDMQIARSWFAPPESLYPVSYTHLVVCQETYFKQH